MQRMYVITKKMIEDVFEVSISDSIPQQFKNSASNLIRENQSFDYYMGLLEAFDWTFVHLKILEEKNFLVDTASVFTASLLAMMNQIILILKSNSEFWEKIPEDSENETLPSSQSEMMQWNERFK